MNTYTLYRGVSYDGVFIYCYAHNTYCSRWQLSIAKALKVSTMYMPDHRAIYNSNDIIYESDQPITFDSHPEFFL